MDKKDVVINIVGKQMVNGEYDTIEMTTVGTYEKLDKGYALVYDEHLPEAPASTTRLQVESDGKIILSRSGENPSSMIIEKGQRHLCHYSTPFGEILMGIFTEYIDLKKEDGKGELNFKYTIDINSSLASRNNVNITFEEA